MPKDMDTDEVGIWAEPDEETVAQFVTGPQNLINEVAEAMLRPVREARFTWAMTKESEQRATIGNVKAFAHDLVMRMVTILNSGEVERIPMRVKTFKVTDKMELEAVLTGRPELDHLGLLADCKMGAHTVLVLAVSPADYAQGEAPQAQPDQRDMPLAEEGDEEEPRGLPSPDDFDDEPED